ncbi:metal-dependent hydrolase [Candidatus Woesearchaeota archaeon]|nr:metal-dependent hydrolase [Candidatus Woesearchaeota archaeon]
MMYHTHLVFGLLFALLVLAFINPANKYIFLAVVVLAALLPDIDHENSKINSKIPGLRFLSKVFGHRGFLHSIWIPLALWLIIDFGFHSRYGSAVFIGYLSHLFSDGLTRSGINIVHPFKQLRIQGFIETGSVLEHLVFFFTSVLCIVLIVG